MEPVAAVLHGPNKNECYQGTPRPIVEGRDETSRKETDPGEAEGVRGVRAKGSRSEVGPRKATGNGK